MAELRSKSILVNLEPTLHSIASHVAGDQSLSAYCRSLIIQDLSEKGLLPESVLIEVLTSANR